MLLLLSFLACNGCSEKSEDTAKAKKKADTSSRSDTAD